MSARTVLGQAGENMACDLFRRAGFEIAERNFRCELGEIDIVAMRRGLIVFCEVKTRRSSQWGTPAEAVNALKRARIRKLAVRWLAERRVQVREIRFDVVSVIVDGAGTRVDHLVDAF
jgi:putative endonuclease